MVEGRSSAPCIGRLSPAAQGEAQLSIGTLMMAFTVQPSVDEP